MSSRVIFHSQPDCGQNKASSTIFSLFVYQITKSAHIVAKLNPMRPYQTPVEPKKWFAYFILLSSRQMIMPSNTHGLFYAASQVQPPSW